MRRAWLALLLSVVACINHARVAPGAPVHPASLVLCSANYGGEQVALNCRPYTEAEWAHVNPQHALFAATGRPPIINPAWATTEWDFDFANALGCASDNNTCTSRTCGSGTVGPCLTWHEVWDGRLGCYGAPANCPRLRQDTAFIALSSQAVGADQIFLRPSVENGSIVSFQGVTGASQQKCTGTLGGVVAKNQTTGQLLNATLCGGLAAGLLVVNTTHPSAAWTYKLVSGTTWAMSQPLAPGGLPQNGGAAEVNTWTNGDSYTVYDLVKVNIHDASAELVDYNATFDNPLYVYRVHVQDTFPGAASEFNLNHAALVESVTDRGVMYWNAEQSSNYGTGLYNVYNNAGLAGGMNGSWYFWVHGGVLTATSFWWNSTWMEVDGDFIDAIPTAIPGVVLFGSMYIESGSLFRPIGLVNIGGAILGGDGQDIFWGPGGISVDTNNGRILYRSGASQAAATFKNSGVLQIGGSSTACSQVGSGAAVTINCGITITPTALDTCPASTTAFCGNAFQLGSGAFSNLL